MKSLYHTLYPDLSSEDTLRKRKKKINHPVVFNVSKRILEELDICSI